MEICESHDSIKRSRFLSRQSSATSSRQTLIISLVLSHRNSAFPNCNLTSSRRNSEISLTSAIDHELVHLSLEIYENQEQINNLLANNADINLSKHEESN